MLYIYYASFICSYCYGKISCKINGLYQNMDLSIKSTCITELEIFRNQPSHINTLGRSTYKTYYISVQLYNCNITIDTSMNLFRRAIADTLACVLI